MLPVILMAHSPSPVMKDGIHYFPGMLTSGFPGGSTGGCSSWGVGSGEGEAGGGSAALGAVLAECCSGEMLWSVPCET